MYLFKYLDKFLYRFMQVNLSIYSLYSCLFYASKLYTHQILKT